MKNLFKFITAAMALIAFSTTTAFAGQDCSKGTTKEDAIKLAQDAVKYVADNGKAKAFKAISDPKSQFKNCELFLIVLDMKGNTLAHTALPKMIGKNIMGITDKNGVKIIESFFAAVKDKSSGWSAQYDFPNPATKVMEPKNTYIEKVVDPKGGDFIIAAGYHKAT